MKITANRSEIAFSFLLLITSCTAVSNPASQSQQKLEAQVAMQIIQEANPNAELRSAQTTFLRELAGE